MSDSKQFPCPKCDGFGYFEYETPIIDYNWGHDIWTETRGCEECCGTGVVDYPPDEEDEEE